VLAAVALVVAATGGGATAAKTAARVEFRPVLTMVPPAGVTTTTLAPADRASAAVTVASCDASGVAALPVVPTTRWRTAAPADCVVYPGFRQGTHGPRYYLGPAGDLPVAEATSPYLAGQGWTVKIDFTKAGARAWDRLARQQFHRQVAVTYQGLVVSAPTIQPSEDTFTSFRGKAVISGDFGQKEAQALASAIRLANGR